MKHFWSYDNNNAVIKLPRKPELNLKVQFTCLPLSTTAGVDKLNIWNGGLNGQTATVILLLLQQ